MRPTTTILLPPARLASCVFAGIYRDTRGTSLADRERINHFPASPIVAVTKVFHGELFFLSSASDVDRPETLQPLPKLFVSGPQDTPISSWSPDSVTALTVGFYYDAWRRIGGDAEFASIPEFVENAFEQFEVGAADHSEWDTFTGKLTAHWVAKSGHSRTQIRGVSDWAQMIATRAALSTTGRSVRSLQRLLRRDSGQTQRTLDFFSKLEDVNRQQSQSSETSLAEFAIEAGFSDQAHLGRAVRRLTGFSPAELNRAIKEDEAFWCYRLLGERF